MKKKWFGWLLFLLLISSGSYYLLNHLQHQQQFSTNSQDLPIDAAAIKKVTVESPQMLYGCVPVDDKVIIQDRIRRNEPLSKLLEPYNVPYSKINEVAQKSKKVYDVRRINYEHQYTLICAQDSAQTAEQMIYEIDPVNFVIFNFKDSVYVRKGQRPVEIVEKAIAGKITSSLYQTMIEEGATPVLANELSDLYAWQVDFFHVQKGDRFKVIYKEKQVDGKSVGIDRIEGAYFHHAGNDYWGIYYQSGTQDSYYDEEGNSMRKAFLKAPLKYSRISSSFSRRRFHPVQKRWKAHLGTDYAAPTGTPIMSVGDGVITDARYKRFNGNYVKVRHNATYTTQYLHMSKIAKGIRPGVHIKQGQVIGYVGMTGLATGPHCCFRFWKNGKQVDPRRQKIPAAKPIADDQREAYNIVRDEMVKRLNQVHYDEPRIDLHEKVTGVCTPDSLNI